jgi:hypothetical protein
MLGCKIPHAPTQGCVPTPLHGDSGCDQHSFQEGARGLPTRRGVAVARRVEAVREVPTSKECCRILILDSVLLPHCCVILCEGRTVW